MQPGQSAEVSVDAYDGKTYKGHVDSISAATGATFSLLPPDNASGNFVKVVQRVPVKIVLDAGAESSGRAAAGHVRQRDGVSPIAPGAPCRARTRREQNRFDQTSLVGHSRFARCRTPCRDRPTCG